MTRVGFTYESAGKAVHPVQVESGDLLISGHCLVWDDTDRDQENWLRSAATVKALREFARSGGSINWIHSDI